jgi:molybdopterin-guanine dinucleotide biosynthesis protein A
MGTSKSLLELDGRRFIERIFEAARPVFDHVIAVTRVGDAPWDGMETIHDAPHAERSPIHGIRRALDHGGDRIWILAADYPLVTAEVLRYLRARFERSQAALFVPVWHGHPQMLCAGYSRSLRDMLEVMIGTGNLRLRELLSTVESERCEEDELRAAFVGEPLWNVNLPDELKQVRKDYER